MAGTREFADKENRKEEMAAAIEDWITDLSNGVEEVLQSEEFKNHLEVMASFHTYSRNNQYLISAQYPNATRVAGFNTWKNDFNRTVKEGESAIWIWAPITTGKCPECGNSEKYHNIEDCDYTEEDPEDWSSGVVGFRPVPVFDVSQTEGEPLPELDTETMGDSNGLLPAICNAADSLGVPSVKITDTENWDHGSARGVSYTQDGSIEAVNRDNKADLTTTLIHETAHTMLHSNISADNKPEKEKREVEAEATAYVVGRHFGLDMSGSEFYLAAWIGDKTEIIEDRLNRISNTAQKIITATENYLENNEENSQNEENKPETRQGQIPG